jgi:hypothetical protein
MDVARLHPVAQLYTLSTLDCLVELASAVAQDGQGRPDRYKGLSEGGARALAELGNDGAVPSLKERTALYEVISGGPDAALSPLAAAEWSFRHAAVEVTKAQDARRELLAKVFADRSASLRSFLELVGGDEAGKSAEQMAALFDLVTTLLTDEALAQVFGVEAPRSPWPLGDASPAGAHLVEVLSDDLQPEAAAGISQYEFLVLQRLATHRGEVIQAVLDGRFSNGRAAEPESLAAVAAWHYALDDFEIAMVARNWRGQPRGLTAEDPARGRRSPVDAPVLSEASLEFINSCAGDGT